MKFPLILLSFLLSLPCYAQTKLHLRGQSGNLLYTQKAGGAAPADWMTAQMSSGCKLRLEFASATGTNFTDTSGVGNNATTSYGTVIPNNHYLVFTNGCIKGTDTQFPTNNTSSTFVQWIFLRNMPAVANLYLLSFNYGTAALYQNYLFNSPGYSAGVPAGVPTFFNQGGVATGGVVLVTNAWYLLAINTTNITASIWVGTTNTASKSMGSMVIKSSGIYAVGNGAVGANPNPFPGSIGATYMFNYNLTTNEMELIFNNTKAWYGL